MKFLAILRDSFKETTDFKVFHVLLGLSILLTVLTVCVSFPRLPIEQTLENNLKPGRNVRSDFTVSNVETLERSLLTRHARYRFTLTPVSPNELAEQMRRGIRSRIQDQEQENAFKRLSLGLEERATTLNPELMMQRVMEISHKRFEARLKELLPTKEPPSNDEQWSQLATNVLKTVPGITQATVTSGKAGMNGQPEDFSAEVTLNWAELPYSHRMAILFGAWNIDLGPATLAEFMGTWVYPSLIKYLAGWVGITIAVVVTAGFIPNMLNKGTIDMLLVKPISRPALLIYKYLGGLAFILINATIFVGGTWLAFGFSTGNWSPWYLVSIPVLTFYFAILYSLSVWIGVLTRSPLASILITIGFWFILFLVSWIYTEAHRPGIEKLIKEQSETALQVLDIIHYALPRPGDLTVLNNFLILRASGSEEMLKLHQESVSTVSWTESLTVSLVFIALMLGLSCWRFSRRDY